MMNRQNKLTELSNMHISDLSNFIKEQEEKILREGGIWFCPNHNLEIRLFEYYDCRSAYGIPNGCFHTMYRVLAHKRIETDDLEGALQAFYRALQYNPTDMEIMEELGKLYWNTGNWPMMQMVAERLYPFCYTRKDIAFYYRLLGCYYLETYEPLLSQIVYTYSNLFYKSKEADSDIRYLEKALEKSMPSYHVTELQDILIKNGIPLQPKQETLGILYGTAKEELKNGRKEYARMLFLFLYQLTHDKEVEKLLDI